MIWSMPLSNSSSLSSSELLIWSVPLKGTKPELTGEPQSTIVSSTCASEVFV